MSGEHVLVTGGSGFLGAHCVARLLADGYRVSTTVRTTGRAGEVRAMLAAAGSDRAEDVRFVAADLTKDDGWDEAVAGTDYVLYVASPSPATAPAHEDDLIVPARNGALRVLRAARRAEVRRVVLTSSFAAIGYGHAPTDEPYDETSWTDPDAPGVSAYAKSKTLAERVAWDFVDRHDRLELAVVNPTGILGPALGPGDGTLPGRDREPLTRQTAAAAARLGRCRGRPRHRRPPCLRNDRQRRRRTAIPRHSRPDVPARHGGRPHRATSAKSEQLLGWKPRPKENAVLAAGRSILARVH
jgi:nucleoside-diphosphate-sugar epimerase